MSPKHRRLDNAETDIIAVEVPLIDEAHEKHDPMFHGFQPTGEPEPKAEPKAEPKEPSPNQSWRQRLLVTTLLAAMLALLSLGMAFWAVTSRPTCPAPSRMHAPITITRWLPPGMAPTEGGGWQPAR